MKMFHFLGKEIHGYEGRRMNSAWNMKKTLVNCISIQRRMRKLIIISEQLIKCINTSMTIILQYTGGPDENFSGPTLKWKFQK